MIGGTAVIENVGLVDATITATNYVGGLVGYSEGSVRESYVNASVSGGNDWVGGLVGYNGGSISESYTMGDVTGDDIVGGLAGKNNGPVSESYAAGSVSGTSLVGGLIGDTEFGNVNGDTGTKRRPGNPRRPGVLVSRPAR
ncbi:MAG: GLUG motif-containing protein [Natrialbaceae archaeon]|nr:GLUG motif-containing protein [Natrialbaceae archaeon]